MTAADTTQARISDLRRQALAAHEHMCGASLSIANHLLSVRSPGWEKRMEALTKTYQRYRDDWNTQLDRLTTARREADDIGGDLGGPDCGA